MHPPHLCNSNLNDSSPVSQEPLMVKAADGAEHEFSSITHTFRDSAQVMSHWIPIRAKSKKL